MLDTVNPNVTASSKQHPDLNVNPATTNIVSVKVKTIKPSHSVLSRIRSVRTSFENIFIFLN